MHRGSLEKGCARVLCHCWAAAFRWQRSLGDPGAAARRRGVQVPDCDSGLREGDPGAFRGVLEVHDSEVCDHKAWALESLEQA